MSVAQTQDRLSGWGRVFVPGREIRSTDLERLTVDAHLTRGLGRSYGDASLPAPGDGAVAGTALADRVVAFDADSGVLTAEAGFSLLDLNRTFWPRGFCAPVAPGTQFITLGGMVAADVHGKDHHGSGCVGEHVTSLTMRLADNSIVRVSPGEDGDLFRATLGGMGLTGHILEVSLRLRRIPSSWMMVEKRRVGGLEEFLSGLREAAASFPYTMGWLDCLSRGSALGRGVLMRGRWAAADEAPARSPRALRRPAAPFPLPDLAVSRTVVAAFNEFYYRMHPARMRPTVEHPESFFYPLDAIRDWNYLYGRRGFTQYQCVIPERAGDDGVRQFLELAARKGGASMLSVIKDCGAEGTGLLSFPLRGTSIALDLPVRDGIQRLVDALNEMLIELGGRVYLAKDQFTRPAHYRRMEPRLEAWRAVKARVDPAGRLRSALSRRLELFPA